MAEKKTVFDVTNNKGVVVGTAKTLKGAGRIIDRKDAKAGASIHGVKRRTVSDKKPIRKSGTPVSPPGLFEDVKKPRGLGRKLVSRPTRRKTV